MKQNSGERVSEVSGIVSGIHCTPDKRCCTASVPKEFLTPSEDPYGIVNAFPDIKCFQYPLGYFYCVYISGSIYEMNPIMQAAILEALKHGTLSNS